MLVPTGSLFELSVLEEIMYTKADEEGPTDTWVCECCQEIWVGAACRTTGGECSRVGAHKLLALARWTIKGGTSSAFLCASAAMASGGTTERFNDVQKKYVERRSLQILISTER